jgi:heptosyltransferase-1
VKRILLIRMSSLGDIIHTFPAVTDLRRALPDAALDWVVEEAYVPLACMHPGVTRVLPIALRRWRRELLLARTWREATAFRNGVREPAYDAILDTQGLLKSALVAAAARGPVHGFGRGTARETLATRFYDVTYEFTPADHKVERYRAVAARALGYVSGALDYGLNAPPRPDGIPFSPYCVLLHSTARAAKLWRDVDWIEVGRHLAARGLVCVLPWGEGDERLRAERLATAIPRAWVPAHMPLADACGLIGHAKLVIGVDTGLMHVAAALRVPVLGIFCDSEPLDAHPLGTGRVAFRGGVGKPPSAQDVIAALAELA